MAPTFKSYQQILGSMIRKMLSVNGINDLSTGSVTLTLLEAAAQEIFSEYGVAIDTLDSFSLDSLSGADLDAKAKEMGLNDGRLSATYASGFVGVSDTSFEKISTTLYVGATPPIIGDISIKVADAAEIKTYYDDNGSASIYVGRGTASFEGPLALSGTPIDNTSYWEIPLIGSPLSKNHNLSETIILAQGGDRSISVGTQVFIPANNVSQAVRFRTLQDVVLADGENALSNVLVIATKPGSSSNAPLRSINSFDSPPFTGAGVTNETSFSNARDLESDQELRDRIRDHIQSLSKGTAKALLTGVVGVSDSEENKRVASASLIDPTSTEDIARLFIDDGTGYEPPYAGRGFEAVLSEAVGTEQFLQLGQFPIVKAQVESINEEPFTLLNGDTLIVRVNNTEETITFIDSEFDNISAARATEVAEFINNTSTLFEARTAGGQKRVVVFAKTLNPEQIQVTGGTANTAFLFSTDAVYTLRLYKNDTLLSKDGETAFLESAAKNAWGSFGAGPWEIRIDVNGRPTQYIKLTDTTINISYDGAAWLDISSQYNTFADLGTTATTATTDQWVAVLDQIILGATVTANGSRIKITSDKELSANSKLQMVGGNLLTIQGWSANLIEGKISDYILNRFNGQIEMATPADAGDIFTVSSYNTRARLISNAALGGTFDLTTVDGTIAALYAVVDGNSVIRSVNIAVGDTLTLSNPGGASRVLYTWAGVGANPFSNISVGDYVVITYRTTAWMLLGHTGIFEVTAATGTTFEVLNPQAPAIGGFGAPFTITDVSEVQAFYAMVPPQKIVFTSASLTPSAIAAQINTQIVGAAALSTDDDEVELVTNTYSPNLGSIHIVGQTGNASNVGFPVNEAVSSTPHVATLESSSQLGYRLSAIGGAITTPDASDPYTDVIDAAATFNVDSQPSQWIKYLTGHNKKLKGNIRRILAASQIELRDNTPTGLEIVDKDFLNSVVVGDIYQAFYPYDLEDTDNLVVVMDDDVISKTYSIPLGRHGRLDSGVVPTVTTFDAIDTDANIVGTDFGDTLWNNYDFADYKLWMKARRVVDATNNKNAIIFRAVKFGPTGENIAVSYEYPTEPDLSAEAVYTPSDVATNVNLFLGSGSLKATTQDASTQFDITTPVGVIHYAWNNVPPNTDPGFGAILVGDIVTFSSPNFSFGNNGTFKVSAKDGAGPPLWIEVLDPTASGVVETKTLGNDNAMIAYPLANNTAADLITAVTNTTPLNELLEAILTDEDPFGTTNDGTGTIDYSTIDDPILGVQYHTLVDGENWVRDFRVGGFQFTLKQALSFIEVLDAGLNPIYKIQTAPNSDGTDGERFVLIPSTAKNVVDHLNKSSITALSSNAIIERADEGNKVQISSLLTGSESQVLVSGGLGNANAMVVRSAAAVEGSSLKVSVLSSAIQGFHKGQAINIDNLNAVKNLNTYDAATQVQVSNIAADTQRYALSKVDCSGANYSVVAVGNQITYTAAVGTPFVNAKAGDELKVKIGGPFNASNEGYYPVTTIGGGGANVTVLNPNGVTEAGPIATGAGDIEYLKPFFTEWPILLDGTAEIVVEHLSQDVYRFRHTGIGTAPFFNLNGAEPEDYVVIGTDFAIGNQGKFRMLNVTDTYFEIVNASGVEELVPNVTTLDMYFINSAFTNDTLIVGALNLPAWFSEENQGRLTISSIGRLASPDDRHYVDVASTTYATETIVLGANYLSFLTLDEELYSSLRIIDNIAIDPSNDEKAFIYFSDPNGSGILNADRISLAAGSQISSLNKLGFPIIPVEGIDGYKYWTGLLRKVQRTVDGYEADPIVFEGLKAAGVQIDVLPPLLQIVKIGLDVKTISGVSLDLVTPAIKSAVLAYISSLGVGSDVLFNQIVSRVTAIPGVETVKMTEPDPSLQVEPRIIIQDSEKAIATEGDILVG